MYDKLLINCSLNPISVLARMDCGEVMANPPLRELLSLCVGEALQVAEALNSDTDTRAGT